MLNGSKNEYPSVTFTTECIQNPQLISSIVYAASSLFLFIYLFIFNPWMAWHGHMCQTSFIRVRWCTKMASEVFWKSLTLTRNWSEKKSIKLLAKARFHPVTVNTIRWKAWNEWYDAKHKIYMWWGHLSWIQAFPCKFRHANCPIWGTLMFYFL